MNKIQKLRSAVGRAAFESLLVQKRLLFKPAFLVILLLIPLLALSFLGVAKSHNGILRVCVCTPSGEEKAEEIAGHLMRNPGILAIERVGSEEEARRRVEEGESDAAWIILPHIDENVRAFVRATDSVPLVLCLEQERNIYLNLGREKLFTAIFPLISREIYAKEMEFLSGRTPTAEEVEESFVQSVKNDELVIIQTIDNKTIEDENFAASPIRGLLSLLILSCGMACAILCAQDRESGLFLLLTGRRSAFIRFLLIFLPMLDLAVVSYIAMAILGLVTSPLLDAAALFVFVLACTGLCALLYEILRTPLRLGIALLPLLLATIALTPIFLNVRSLRALSYLLPSYHYLVALRSERYLLYLLAYALICAALALLIAYLRARGSRPPKRRTKDR